MASYESLTSTLIPQSSWPRIRQGGDLFQPVIGIQSADADASCPFQVEPPFRIFQIIVKNHTLDTADHQNGAIQQGDLLLFFKSDPDGGLPDERGRKIIEIFFCEPTGFKFGNILRVFGRALVGLVYMG